MEGILNNFIVSSTINNNEIIQSQIEKIIKGSNFVELVRPATIGDGIIKIDESQENILSEIYNSARLTGRIKKFIPASGAATRMFSRLLSAIDKFKDHNLETILNTIEFDKDASYIINIINNIDKFAFYDELIKLLLSRNINFEDVKINNPVYLLSLIVNSDGLNYYNKPKGLIKFHKYTNNKSRTAFIEHLIESSFYQADFNNSIFVHFTISEKHYELFQQEVKTISEFEKLRDFSFNISFSFQSKQTDSITLNENNQIFIDEFGNPLFRPSGHGALLENLNQINGDIVFIKNIDNICVEKLLPITVKYKILLGGLLILIQKKIFEYLRILENKSDDSFIRDEIIKFCSKLLNINLPNGFFKCDIEKQRDFLFNRLNRPIRVCGVVKNQGEPGGAPFWVKRPNNQIDLQIVEQPQIDFSNQEQKLIFNNSTHFNPVDIVAGIKDFKGRNFDLFKFRDEDSFMIVNKKVGKENIKSLELPGLWNGGMADWISIFVEVPKETFNPVKEITDLLKIGHIE